ncbi:MAG: quinone oxidoreductase family protein, partial [Rickettsiales bacterium]
MAKAIRIHGPGGTDALSFDDVEVAAPGPGQALLRQTAIGLNYIDVYHRTGLYPLEYPVALGLEACGIVEAVGDGVTEVKVGDRVAYAGGPVGAYAEHRLMPAKLLVKVPDAVSDEQAAGVMVQGLTAHFLLRRTFIVREGTQCLIHAAAGGVGTIMCQWAKHLGAMVIGTVSSEEKAELARANGCDHPIIYTRENIVDRVKEITGGQGVSVVYDSVGKDTFMASLDCLRPFGLLVSFGQASGPVPPFDISLLAQKGSLYMTRPSMMDYMRDVQEYHQSAQELFALVGQGVINVHVGQTYPLEHTAQAHADLEA